MGAHSPGAAKGTDAAVKAFAGGPLASATKRSDAVSASTVLSSALVQPTLMSNSAAADVVFARAVHDRELTRLMVILLIQGPGMA